MLWDDGDNGTQCSVWHMQADGAIDTALGAAATPGFDFYDSSVTGWVASSLSLNPDGSFKVLWDDGDNGTQCSVWHMQADGAIDDSLGGNGGGNVSGFDFYDSGVTGWVAHSLAK